MNNRHVQYIRLQRLLLEFYAATTPENQAQMMLEIGRETHDPYAESLAIVYAQLLAKNVAIDDVSVKAVDLPDSGA